LFKLTQTDNDKDILNKKVLIDLYRSVEG
jgi:hypothetical protein